MDYAKQEKLTLAGISAGLGAAGCVLIGTYLIHEWREVDPWGLVVVAAFALLPAAFLIKGVQGIRGVLWPAPLPSSHDPREIVSSERHDFHGFALVLAYVFFGGIAISFIWWSFDDLPQGVSPTIKIEGLFHAGIALFVVAWLTHRWLRRRRYGRSVCRLLTFPPTEGGRFEADVDCALPANSGEPVIARLKCHALTPGTRGTPPEVWRSELKLDVAVTRGKRAIVPVRLDVPLNAGRAQMRMSPDAFRYWMLEIEKKAPGVDFFAEFLVPIEEASDAPRPG